jgi:hypothetical protein
MAFFSFFIQNQLETGTVNEATTKIPPLDNESVHLAHLQAIFMDNSEMLVIKINGNSQKNLDLVKTVRNSEPNWMLMKKMIVNELFGTIRFNLGFMIEKIVILKIYSFVMNNRNINKDIITSANTLDKVLWFLYELSLVQPDASVIATYQELYPEVNRQYLLSYLFWQTAHNIKKPINLASAQNPGIIKSVITKSIKEAFNFDDTTLQSVEFENYLDKYLPVTIRYIMNESSRIIEKENVDIDIFFIHDYITDKKQAVNINPANIFKNKKPPSKKKTAEISTNKKGVIQIEVATPPGVVESNVDNKLKVDSKNVQSNSKRTKGDEMEDIKESPLDLYRKNEIVIEESVPDTLVKNFKQLDSRNYNEVSSKKEEAIDIQVESIINQQTVSDKQKKKHTHGDL